MVESQQTSTSHDTQVQAYSVETAHSIGRSDHYRWHALHVTDTVSCGSFPCSYMTCYEVNVSRELVYGCM